MPEPQFQPHGLDYLYDNMPSRPEDQPTAPEAPMPGVLDTLAAAFREMSPVANLVENDVSHYFEIASGNFADRSYRNPTYKPLQGYTPYADPAELQDIPTEQLHLFMRSGSPEETAYLKRQIQEEQRSKDVIQQAGYAGKAAVLAAAVLDPITVLSMAVPVAAPEAWGTRVERVMAAVAATTATDTASEIALHQSQQLRTINDSLENIGAGILFGSAIGTWATRMPKSEFERISRDVAREFSTDEARSVGAAQAGGDTTLEDEGIASGGRWLARTVGKISPVTRVLSSSSREARMLVQQLAEIPYLLEKNLRGLRTGPIEGAVEVRVRQRTQQSLVRTVQNLETFYNKYRERMGADAMSMREFGLSVSGAMRREDISEIPEVSGMAREMRKLFDEDRKAFEDLGLLPEEAQVLGAKSYFPRVYDHDKILRERGTFAAMLRKYFAENPKPLEETKDVAAARKRLMEQGSDGVDTAAATDARAAEREAATAAHGEATGKIREHQKAVETARRELRDLQQKSREAGRRVSDLEAKRADYPVMAAGATPEHLASVDANLAAGIEKAKAAEEEIGDRFLAKEKELRDLQGARTELKQAAKETRRALREASAALDAAKSDAKLVQKFEDAKQARLTAYRDPAEIEAEVQDTIDNILGTFRGAADLGKITNPKVTKHRTLDVPDTLLEPWLVSDPLKVMQGYTRSVAPAIEMRKTFGSVDMAAEIRTVEESYQAKIANAKSNEEAEKLTREAQKVVTDLHGMVARVNNQVGPKGANGVHWIQAFRVLRQYNYMRLLGGQTVSSLSDLGHVISKYGLVKTGKSLARFLGSSSFRNMTKADNNRMGTATEWLLESRVGTYADISEDLAGTSGVLAKAEHLAHAGSKVFTRVTLMASWNSLVKNLTAIMEQDAILRAAVNPGKMRKGQVANMAQLGFEGDDLRRLAEQFQKHGEDTDGLLRARTDLWDDRDLAKRFEAAVLRAGDIMSISRGMGDLPFLMDSEVAKTLFQFKSFGMVSVNRIMIPVTQGLAHDTAVAANGLAMMTALGAMTYYAKQFAAGQEPDTDPGVIVKEAINWSGMAGFLPDLTSPVAAISPYPVRSWLQFSKFADRAPMEAFAGPTFGTGADTFAALSNLTGPTNKVDLSPSVTASDIHKLRKLIPLQNLAYLRRLINAVEGETADMLNAEGATYESFWDRVTKDEPLKEK